MAASVARVPQRKAGVVVVAGQLSKQKSLDRENLVHRKLMVVECPVQEDAGSSGVAAGQAATQHHLRTLVITETTASCVTFANIQSQSIYLSEHGYDAEEAQQHMGLLTRPASAATNLYAQSRCCLQ